ncbi:MAG TPA: cardiolipin synthase [Pirellulaceae bacterium]|nr:cardiolipin synthase [Pirellulaceae bacterium]
MGSSGWLAFGILLVDLSIRVGLSIRVIMRRRPVGVTLAWLAILLMSPFLGAFIYLLVGERLLGRKRLERVAEVSKPYRAWLTALGKRDSVDWSRVGVECEPLARVALAASGIPALPGNAWRLLDSAEQVFDSLIADIDRARHACHLEFYIWNPGGDADKVVAALLHAAQRGVVCRVLVDAVGSRDFLRSEWARQLRAGGVQLIGALPAGIFRMWFERVDLRLHRKIVVIDGRIAYTGSLNLVDPRCFKQDAGVGQWIDAMVRIEGPAVEALGVTFLGDWAVEGAESHEAIANTSFVGSVEPLGTAAIQVCPSGPTDREQAIQEVLLTAIYAARRELILTSPYFVPDETMLTALISAAHRGVDVTLIVPKRVDSLLVRLASTTCRGDLVDAGVRIMEFDGGLLHTKSVTVDGEFSLFGSLNLDPRSLYLNFEITLCVYDREFTSELRGLQQRYLADCETMDMRVWNARTPLRRLAANVGRLLSPLL